MLVEHGANVLLVDDLGFTPVDVAKGSNVQVLLKGDILISIVIFVSCQDSTECTVCFFPYTDCSSFPFHRSVDGAFSEVSGFYKNKVG
jgi:hypothetical protein